SPVVLEFEIWGEKRKSLPVDVVDDRRGKQEAANPPTQRRDRPARGRHWRGSFLLTSLPWLVIPELACSADPDSGAMPSQCRDKQLRWHGDAESRRASWG